MIELQLAHHRKARVWLGDLPDARVNPWNVSERTVRSANSICDEVRRAAIEILIPRGARALYGLLGAVLRPNQSEALVIRVVSSDDGGICFPDSIALSSDETRVGLPRAFSHAVLEGAVNQIIWIGGLGSGELFFSHAVHSLVGSAPIVFKWLGAAIVQLLREGEGISQKPLASILEAAI